VVLETTRDNEQIIERIAALDIGKASGITADGVARAGRDPGVGLSVGRPATCVATRGSSFSGTPKCTSSATPSRPLTSSRSSADCARPVARRSVSPSRYPNVCAW
jgi:hypothetical protein